MIVRTLQKYELKKGRKKRDKSISVSGKTCTLITTLLDRKFCERGI
jgi:hypothetical protein